MKNYRAKLKYREMVPVPPSGGHRADLIDVLCETPSKFTSINPPSPPDPYPDQVRVERGTTPNTTYLLSEFQLPWADAVAFCRDRGGWLAEVETAKENLDLSLKIQRRDRIASHRIASHRIASHRIWLGGKLSDLDSGWRWSSDNRHGCRDATLRDVVTIDLEI